MGYSLAEPAMQVQLEPGKNLNAVDLKTEVKLGDQLFFNNSVYI